MDFRKKKKKTKKICTVPLDSSSSSCHLCLGERSLFFFFWPRILPASLGKRAGVINQCVLSALGLDGCWTQQRPGSSRRGLSDWLPPAPPLGASGSGAPSDASFRELWRSREARPLGASFRLQEVPAGGSAGLLTRLYRGSRDRGWIMWIPPMGMRRLGARPACWECKGR